jgi:hypothetical protein
MILVRNKFDQEFQQHQLLDIPCYFISSSVLRTRMSKILHENDWVESFQSDELPFHFEEEDLLSFITTKSAIYRAPIPEN